MVVMMTVINDGGDHSNDGGDDGCRLVVMNMVMMEQDGCNDSGGNDGDIYSDDNDSHEVHPGLVF